jgi:hypothetical protein
MPRTCTVCRLPPETRQKAETALLRGDPYRDIAKGIGASPDALVRHRKNHLHAKLAKAEAREIVAATSLVTSAGSLIEKLERYERDALRLAKKAEEAGDLRTAASILTTGVTRFVELVARLRGELQQGATINILSLGPEMRAFLEDPAARHALEVTRQNYLMSPEQQEERLQRLLQKLLAPGRGANGQG